MSALLQLAERVEAATGPSAHLDAQIHILIDPDAQHIVDHEPGRFPQKAIYGPRSTFWEWACDETTEPPAFTTIPRYTASLDAAMTLVPEGALWKVDYGIAWSDEYPATEGRNYRAGVGVGEAPVKWNDATSAADPALALCAAALRARASGETE